jgi:mannose-6-phosphate isomerase-like protein (cupin superfamily)
VSVPFILAPGEKHPDAPPLDRPFFRFASGQTGGSAALAEVQLPPLTAGPNLHVYTREDELFFVLDGVMTVKVGEQLHDCGRRPRLGRAAPRTRLPTGPKTRCAS